MTLLHDAIRSVIPAKSRSGPYQGALRIKFDCPMCHTNGHRRDVKDRGAFILNPDGSAGYSCLQCHHDTRQAPDMSLTQKMRSVLIQLGMSDDDVQQLSYTLWAAKITKQQGRTPPPYIERKPLPDGAKTFAHWFAVNITDANFADVAMELADMTDERRDSLYWTPEPGSSGDMNRRYIWAIGPKDAPVGWAALHIDPEVDDQPMLSTPNIFHFKDEDDQ